MPLRTDVPMKTALTRCTALASAATGPGIPPDAWADTTLDLTDLPDGIVLTDCLGGRTIRGGGPVPVGDVLGVLPVACLVAGEG